MIASQGVGLLYLCTLELISGTVWLIAIHGWQISELLKQLVLVEDRESRGLKKQQVTTLMDDFLLIV